MNEGGVQLLVLCLRQDVSINIWRNVLVLQQGIFHGRLTSAAGGITGLWIWLCLDVNIWFLLDFLSSYKGLNTNKSLNTQVNTQDINTSHTSIFIIFHFSWRIFFQFYFIHVYMYLHLKLSQERESSDTYRLSLLSSLLRLPRLEELVSPFPSVSSGHRYTSMGPFVLFSQIWMLVSGSGTSSRVSGGAFIAITVCSSSELMLRMSW